MVEPPAPFTTVYTIGHSTRSFDEFLALLRSFAVEAVADVRTIPQSRRHPQFSQRNLEAELAGAGLDYRHFRALGGLRHPAPDSPNSGWRNASFRGYADHMQSDAFAAAVDELLALGAERRIAVMCAEAVPWRCHRSLLADALLVRGAAVADIMSTGKATAHRLTPFAAVEGTRITYPPLV